MQQFITAFVVALTTPILAPTARANPLPNTVPASVQDSVTLTDTLVDMARQSVHDCGCNGTLSLDEAPGIVVRNNADCLTGLDASLVTVLGAFPDDPSLYYGENAVNGWVALGDRALEFRFEALGYGGLPLSANIYLDFTPVATVVYPPAYETRPFAVLYESRVYCGTVFNGDIRMTAVPEPGVGISLLVGIGAVALLGMRQSRRSQAG